MPLNLLKVYNQLLELASMKPLERTISLKKIFNRDIAENSNFTFRNKALKPTPKDGVVTMETLFSHLTTIITDKKTKSREFDIHRSVRLHWVKYHLTERKTENLLVFSVKEPEGNRTYIYDKTEKYAIVLEPLRSNNEYYLLTAYPLM
jgi:hypothetical protein